MKNKLVNLKNYCEGVDSIMSNDSQTGQPYFWTYIKELTKDVQVDLDEPLGVDDNFYMLKDYCYWDIKKANEIFNTLHKVEDMINVEPKDMLYVVIEKDAYTNIGYYRVHKKEESRVAARNYMHSADYVFLINTDYTYTVVKTLEGFQFISPVTLKSLQELYDYLMDQDIHIVVPVVDTEE